MNIFIFNVAEIILNFYMIMVTDFFKFKPIGIIAC